MMLLCARSIVLVIRLEGDLVVYHVNGTREYNLLSFSVGRLIKKDGGMFYIQNSTKIKRFWRARQSENGDRSSVTFVCITANMTVI